MVLELCWVMWWCTSSMQPLWTTFTRSSEHTERGCYGKSGLPGPPTALFPHAMLPFDSFLFALLPHGSFLSLFSVERIVKQNEERKREWRRKIMNRRKENIPISVPRKFCHALYVSGEKWHAPARENEKQVSRSWQSCLGSYLFGQTATLIHTRTSLVGWLVATEPAINIEITLDKYLCNVLVM